MDLTSIKEQARKEEYANKRMKYTNHIRSGHCPICSGKLIRGKKDKNNDYKRTWDCAKCETVYSI